ncbi:MAG: propanediol utilization microcompartment protein PduB [Firmicutes bacterium]|nr:propanediol utilization microcompartment protein PduB [Bacillota bacterium]
MTDSLTEKIIRDILARCGTADTAAGARLQRPNYQREKWKPRVGSRESKDHSPAPSVNACVLQPAATAPLVQSNLPAGALLGFAVKRASPGHRPAEAGPEEPVGCPADPTSRTTAPEEPRGEAPDLPGIEFQGVAGGDTFGYVMADMDLRLIEHLKIVTQNQAVGVLCSRRGAAPLIVAADEACGSADVGIADIELVDGDRGKRGALVVFEAQNALEATRVVETCLNNVKERQRYILETGAGGIETLYCSRAARIINRLFNVPLGRACGVIAGYPAAVGLAAASVALKSADVFLESFCGPSSSCRVGNEFWTVISGDPSRVKTALDAAHKMGAAILQRLATNTGEVSS